LFSLIDLLSAIPFGLGLRLRVYHN
jgi:hypothetical protein